MTNDILGHIGFEPYGNDTVKSLLNIIRAKNETIEQLVDDKLAARAGMDRLRMRSDKQQREIAELRSRLDKVEQAVLDMGKAMPRIEREVSRFERLNNNNTFGG